MGRPKKTTEAAVEAAWIEYRGKVTHVARALGVTAHTVYRYLPGGYRRTPKDKLREKFESIELALYDNDGNKKEAAKQLGISAAAVHYYLKHPDCMSRWKRSGRRSGTGLFGERIKLSGGQSESQVVDAYVREALAGNITGRIK